MFAINHAATALILKKKYSAVPMTALLISVQLMEFLWVALNYLGIEKTKTESVVRFVGDIHLSYMPFSHSVATSLAVALAAWLVLGKLLKRPLLGIAVGLGIASHLVLDLLTHNGDIALAPFLSGPMLGLPLYGNWPIAAFLLELGYGVFCWWVYGGRKSLLAVIVIFNLANLSMFSSSIAGPEAYMVDRPFLLTTVIFIQIVATLLLVGLFSGKRSSSRAA